MKTHFITVSFFVATATIAAQVQEKDTAQQHLLQELQVVINKATSHTPVAFTNIGKEQLQRANQGQDIPHMLSGVPSLISTSDAGAGVGYTSMRIRGTDATRINVTLNGIPINEAESHHVYWVNTPDLASSLQDIQIQRGVGTSVNGAASFGASINMRTESAERGATLTAGYGSFNTKRLTLKAGTGVLGSGAYFDTRLSAISTDGYIDRASAALNSYHIQAGWLKDHTHLRLLAFGGKETTYHAWDYPSRQDMETHGRTYNPCGLISDGVYYKNQIDTYNQTNTQLLLDRRLSSAITLNAGLHYTKGSGYYEQYKNARLKEYGLQPTASKTGLTRRKHVEGNFFGAIFALSHNKQPLQLVWGGAISRYINDHYGNILWIQQPGANILSPNQEYYRNNGRKTDANTYLKTTLTLTTNLHIYADMQYRHVRYSINGNNDNYDHNTQTMQALNTHNTYHFLNPKAGITYQDNAHRAYLNISIANKEPVRNNYTDYTNTDYAGNISANPLPQVERLYDCELGYIHKAQHLSAGVNLYYMRYRNQFVSNGQLNNIGEAVAVNVPHSYRMGIELEAAYKPCNILTWEANATLSHNRIKNHIERIIDDWYEGTFTQQHYSSTTIALSPSLMINNTLNLHHKGFGARLHTQYISRQYLTNTEVREMSLPPYLINNLQLSFQHQTPFAQVRYALNIYNLLDKQYEANGWGNTTWDNNDPTHNTLIYYSGYSAQASRHIQATISMTF